MAEHVVQTAVMRHDGRTYTKGAVVDLDAEQAKRYQGKGWTTPKSQAGKDTSTDDGDGVQAGPALPSNTPAPNPGAQQERHQQGRGQKR